MKRWSSPRRWPRFVARPPSDPQRALAPAWISRTALQMGDAKGAEAASRAAAQLIGAETSADDRLFAAATLAEAQADRKNAEERYRELASWHPDDPWYRAEWADFLKRQARNAEAVDAYHRVLDADPGYTRVHVDLCQLYARLDDYPLAEQHADAALKQFREAANPGGEAQALLCLGDVERRVQGGTHLADAKRHIEAARDIFDRLRVRIRPFPRLSVSRNRHRHRWAISRARRGSSKRPLRAAGRPATGRLKRWC